MLRYLFIFGFSASVGCHTAHKVSARVSGVGHCQPDITVQTLTKGHLDFQYEELIPWQHEFAPELDELKIDAISVDSDCQMTCQITVDGAVAVLRTEAKRALCEWKR